MIRTTSRNGFHMTFQNGCTVSVQWEQGNYCSPLRGPHDISRAAALAEVAVFDPGGAAIASLCHGWQTPDDVARLIAEAAAWSG